MAPIPCAAHVPPRCRGKTKGLSKCQDEFHAAIHAASRSSDCMQKAWPKSMRRAAPRPSWRPLKSTLEPLGKHLRHLLPKSWIFEALGESWEAKAANLAPIPCAAHVPPRCRGESKSRSKWQSVVTAFLKAFCDETRGVAKSMAKEF